jgi:hypothetical protein
MQPARANGEFQGATAVRKNERALQVVEFVNMKIGLRLKRESDALSIELTKTPPDA